MYQQHHFEAATSYSTHMQHRKGFKAQQKSKYLCAGGPEIKTGYVN